MSSRSNALLILGLLAAATAACSGRPVSLGVQAGSTIGIPVGGEVTSAGSIGYGGALLAADGQYDDQRGELVFVLKDTTNPALQYTLSTQAVVNAYPDPASAAGIGNFVPNAFNFDAGLSQALAIVDIPLPTASPPGPPPGIYEVIVSRRVRTSEGSPPQYEALLPAPVYPMGAYRLTILPGTGTPTPISTYYGFLGEIDTSAGIRSLYPYPKLVLTLPTLSGSAIPAAAHLVVSYPAAKLAIKSVFEEQHLGRGSVLTWSADTSAGTVTIDLVNADPTSSAASLGVAFDLSNPFGSGATGGRATTADFTVTAASLYDANGALASAGPSSVVKGQIR